MWRCCPSFPRRRKPSPRPPCPPWRPGPPGRHRGLCRKRGCVCVCQSFFPRKKKGCQRKSGPLCDFIWGSISMFWCYGSRIDTETYRFGIPIFFCGIRPDFPDRQSNFLLLFDGNPYFALRFPFARHCDFQSFNSIEGCFLTDTPICFQSDFTRGSQYSHSTCIKIFFFFFFLESDTSSHIRIRGVAPFGRVGGRAGTFIPSQRN